MSKLWNRHFFLGRLANRTDDEFIGEYSDSIQVRPDAFRWFCGMYDMEETFICQLL